MIQPDHEARLTLAIDLARQAQEYILSHYLDQSLEVERKGDESPVTVADRGAEQLIRDVLAEKYPEDGIQGEEFEDVESKNGYRWVLDPIDGTKSFIHGVPLFGTLIGVEQDSESVVGVCNMPGLDEMVYAAKGGGCWWKRSGKDPERCSVSQTSSLAESMMCITTITGWSKAPETFRELCDAVRLVRSWGDCYGHILVATGRVDLMVETGMNPWDAAPFVPILQEAGGHYVSWDGVPSHLEDTGLSVNAALKDDLLALIQRCERK